MTDIDQARYVEFDPFLDCDRDVDIAGRKVRIVKTRTPHHCATPFGVHDLAPGSIARFESAIVDGEPGSFYTCIECIDLMMEPQNYDIKSGTIPTAPTESLASERPVMGEPSYNGALKRRRLADARDENKGLKEYGIRH